jgi:asparagine synthase (glutamine-hydrolysing)
MARDGWPKFIMRSALRGQLPDAVRWRRGKQHLGWPFTRAVMTAQRDQLALTAAEDRDRIGPYIDIERFDQVYRDFLKGSPVSHEQEAQLYTATMLSRWLARQFGS